MSRLRAEGWSSSDDENAVEDDDIFVATRHAMCTGDIDPLMRHIVAGADVNEIERPGEDDFFGRTALHIACGGAHVRFSWVAVDTLLEHGAHTEARNYAQETPLHCAAACSKPRNVRRLLESGADVRATSRRGNTPLHKAVAVGSRACVDALIAEGADVNASNERGKTPLFFAIHYGKLDLARLLLSIGDDRAVFHAKPRGRKVSALVDRVVAAGGWRSYARAHRRVLAGIVGKIAPLLDDTAGIVADFWAPAGGSLNGV